MSTKPQDKVLIEPQAINLAYWVVLQGGNDANASGLQNPLGSQLWWVIYPIVSDSSRE